jgi:hypothetical protein
MIERNIGPTAPYPNSQFIHTWRHLAEIDADDQYPLSVLSSVHSQSCLFGMIERNIGPTAPYPNSQFIHTWRHLAEIDADDQYPLSVLSSVLSIAPDHSRHNLHQISENNRR